MIYNQDCDYITEEKQTDCVDCYRYDICKPYFEAHPEDIYSADSPE